MVSVLHNQVMGNALAVENQLILFDDFNDGNALGWTETLGKNGSWSVDNGEYVGYVEKIGPDNPSISGNFNQPLKNFEFSYNVKNEIGVNKYVLFKYNSLSLNYALDLVSDFGAGGGDQILLTKNTSSGGTVLAQKTFDSTTNTWYHVKILMRDDNIQIFVDDMTTPIVNIYDAVNTIQEGHVALMAWPGAYAGTGSKTRVRFDNITVRNLDALEVPVFYQDEGDYRNDAYGLTPGKTIASHGCWMTSAAMILAAHGIEQIPSTTEADQQVALDPGTLNAWLKENNGYDYEGNTLYTPILRLANDYADQTRLNQDTEDDTPYFTYQSANFSAATESATLDQDLKDGNPDIMRHIYYNSAGELLTHFYVGKGKNDNTYLINDPLDARDNTMDYYNDTFYGLRRFISQDTDPTSTPAIASRSTLTQKPNLSLLMFYTEDPTTHLLLTDSQGRKVGKDSNTGNIFNEIPDSTYEFIPPIGDSTNPDASPLDPGINRLEVPLPVGDKYTLTTHSDQTDDYQVYHYSYNAEADVQILSHLVTPSDPSSKNISFTYDSESGQSTVDEPIPTTHDDLINALTTAQKNNQIRPPLLAHHWINLTKVAKAFHAHELFHAENKILQAIKRQIQTATPKLVQPETSSQIIKLIDNLMDQQS